MNELFSIFIFLLIRLAVLLVGFAVSLNYLRKIEKVGNWLTEVAAESQALYFMTLFVLFVLHSAVLLGLWMGSLWLFHA